MPERYIGELRVLEQINRYEFAFEADILRTGPVQGGRWEFTNLEQNYKTFAGRPVLIAYVGRRVGDGHNDAERIDLETGERYRSFTDATAERIIGMISEEESDLTLFERDGYKWLRVKGRIWSYYAREAVDEIVRTGRMDVSIEAEVYGMREEDGREVYDKWTGLGLTILGAGVDPAVPGANIRALTDMQEEFETMKLRVASLVEEENKPQNKSTTKELKHRMNYSKQQLIQLQERFGAEYKVLAAFKKDGVIHTMLMRKSDYTFCSYEMGESDASVYPEKIVTRAASIVLEVQEGEEALCAEASDVVCGEVTDISAERDASAAENKTLSDTLDSMRSQIAAMQEFETRRRTAAAKDHAKSVLNGYNANRAEKVSETVIASVIEDAGNGAYNSIMDADGNWIGLSAVEKDVKALCADEQMKLDAKNAKDGKTQYVWEHFASESPADDGSPAALIASL